MHVDMSNTEHVIKQGVHKKTKHSQGHIIRRELNTHKQYCMDYDTQYM